MAEPPEIYFDYAATSPLRPEVRALIRSLEAGGATAADALRRARTGIFLQPRSAEVEVLIPALKPLMEDPSPEVRYLAMAAVVLSAPDPVKVESFSKGLEDDDPGVRQRMLELLVRAKTESTRPHRFNEHQHVLAPLLRELLEDESPEIAFRAAQAHWEIQKDRGVVLPAMVRALDAESVVGDALGSLSQIAPLPQAAVPSLTRIAASSDGDGAEALLLLGYTLGGNAVIDTLLKGLSQELELHRAYAASSLGRLRVARPDVVAALARVARDDRDEYVRKQAQAALKLLESND